MDLKYSKFSIIANDDTFITENGDEWKIVSLANLIIVSIMSRGDFNSTYMIQM